MRRQEFLQATGRLRRPTSVVDLPDEPVDFADNLERLLAACQNVHSPVTVSASVPLPAPVLARNDNQPTTSALNNDDDTVAHVNLDTPPLQPRSSTTTYSPISSMEDDDVIVPTDPEPPLLPPHATI